MKDFTKKTLSNGLVVYFYKDKNMKRTYVSYNVKYGTNGYYDEFYYRDKLYHVQPGMAHFLEHTLIETCKHGNMIHKFMDKNYEFNGLTYNELTSFYFVGIKDIKNSLKELIEMVDAPVFDRTSIENVKKAIVDEVRKSDDAKYGLAYNINKRNLYRGFEFCPLNGNVLGSAESTLAITYEETVACYNAYYNVENKFLVIAGNINIDEYTEYLETIFADLDDHPNEMRAVDYGEDRAVRKEYQEVSKRVDTEHLIITFKIESDENPLLIDLALFIFLRTKLANDTKFVTQLLDDKIIVGVIGWNTSYFKGDTLVTFGVDVLNKDEFVNRLTREIANPKIEKRKFELLRRNLIANELSKLDYIYRSLKRFPNDIVYSEKLFAIDVLDECTYERVISIVESLNFDVKTSVLIKKEEITEVSSE